MQELAAGDRVLVIGWPYRGVRATLVRPARLLWKSAWLVAFDEKPRGGWKCDRVIVSRLVPLPISDE